MSLILDALNRAEHERKSKQGVPNLTTVHVASDPTFAGTVKRGRPTIFMVFLVIVVGAGAGVWWFSASHAPEAQPSSLAGEGSVTTNNFSASNGSAPAELPTAIIATPISGSDQKVVTSSSVMSSATLPAGTAPIPTAVDHLYKEASSTPEVTASAPVDELYQSALEPSVSESITTPFEVEEQPVLASAGVETITARNFNDIKDVTDFNDLPWGQKQLIPSISYSQHNYSLQNVSTVVINGETLEVGSALGGQLIVEEIFVDGVVLGFGDKKFKLRALSGWINM